MSDERSSPPPRPGDASVGAGPYCANCGTALTPEARFCTNCGSARQGGPASPPPLSPTPPADDATRVLPAAPIREQRVEAGREEAPVYRGPPPPGFNWPLAVLAVLGLVVLVLALVLFLEQDDDGEVDPATTSTSLTTLPTTSSTSATTASTTTTTEPTTTTSTTTTPTTTTTTTTTAVLPPVTF
ncbi:MAG: zinc-ribbon domain-containing protein [Acidimicrobiales bacterium]